MGRQYDETEALEGFLHGAYEYETDIANLEAWRSSTLALKVDQPDPWDSGCEDLQSTWDDFEAACDEWCEANGLDIVWPYADILHSLQGAGLGVWCSDSFPEDRREALHEAVCASETLRPFSDGTGGGLLEEALREACYASAPLLERVIEAIGADEDGRPDGCGSVNVYVGDTDTDASKLFALHCGAYGNVHVLVQADHLESALDLAAEVLAKKAPGVFCTDAVNEAYSEAMEGVSPDDPEYDEKQEDAMSDAETDMTYTEYGYIASWEWHFTEIDNDCESVARHLADRYGADFEDLENGTEGK